MIKMFSNNSAENQQTKDKSMHLKILTVYIKYFLFRFEKKCIDILIIIYVSLTVVITPKIQGSAAINNF